MKASISLNLLGLSRPVKGLLFFTLLVYLTTAGWLLNDKLKNAEAIFAQSIIPVSS
jgi:hypothetical protein